jgi:hypothetical protein
MTLDRISYQGETIGVELPVAVDLIVTETEPGFAGDTRPAPASRPRPSPASVVTSDLRRGGA